MSGNILYNEAGAAVSQEEKTYIGDVLAAAIVVFFAVASLTISGWSAVLYWTGDIGNGGPVAYLFGLVNSVANLPSLA
jgi:hypothetical protein